MGSHVLVAYDGTPQSHRAAEWVAETFPEAEVTVLTVLDPMEGFLDTFGYGSQQYEIWRDEAEAEATALLEEALAVFPEGATVETATPSGQVPRTIIRYATDHGVDHIVLGSHGRTGVTRVLLGSVAETVVRRSPTTVSVVR